MKQITVTKIQFPEIELRTRDAHKLRGYFGNLFKKHSELLHNHYDSGELRYRYPLVQYKVLNNTPTLLALQGGAELLTKLFLQIKEIDIDGTSYPVNSKQIENTKTEIGHTGELYQYQFQTLWMALNQKNHQAYQKEEQPGGMLEKILVGNILSFYKNMDLRLNQDERIMAKVQVQPKSTKFKDTNMTAFTGSFVTNALLPDDVGIGKGVSRGFGSVKREKV